MVDIQSATAENRRGEKERKKKKEENTGRKYNGLPYSIRRPFTEMLRRSGPVIKSVKSVIKTEGSLWWEKFVKETGVKEKGSYGC